VPFVCDILLKAINKTIFTLHYFEVYFWPFLIQSIISLPISWFRAIRYDTYTVHIICFSNNVLTLNSIYFYVLWKPLIVYVFFFFIINTVCLIKVLYISVMYIVFRKCNKNKYLFYYKYAKHIFYFGTFLKIL